MRKKLQMLDDLNVDLLKANILEQVLKRVKFCSSNKRTCASRPKILIGAIITDTADTAMQAETSLSIADHHPVGCMINIREQRMKPFQIFKRNNSNN